MLTVDYDRLGVGPGDLVLDLGCGFGRHAFEAARRGASVVALDAGPDEVAQVRATLGAMVEAGELAPDHPATAVQGDALALPFADGTFDRVIASEVLEHIPDDIAAMRELARVLAGRRDGGDGAALRARGHQLGALGRVPRHARRPRAHLPALDAGAPARARPASSRPGYHHAHGLHSPYWWLRCLVGPSNDSHPAVAAYHKVLVWDIVKAPFVTRTADRVLSPLIGKSLVRLPDQARRCGRRAARRAPVPAPRACRADAGPTTPNQGAAA